MMGMDPLDDTAHWAHVAGEELALALAAAGIKVLDVEGDEDGVRVVFPNLTAAEALLVLVTDGKAEVGSLYDRAASSCPTLNALRDAADARGEDISDEDLSAAIRAAWEWIIHPHMSGRNIGWHVTAIVPAYDANQMTATLNALRLGGAL